MKRVVVDRSTRWHQLPPDPDQFAELELPGGLERKRSVIDLSIPYQASRGLWPDNDIISQIVSLHSRELAVCVGASSGLLYHLLCQSLLDPGDFALIPDPGEPRLRQGIILAGGNPVTYSLATRAGWQNDFANLRGDIARQARFLVVGWPHYPTGTLPTSEDMRVITRLALKENLLLVIDATHLELNSPLTTVFDFGELARCAVVLLRVANGTDHSDGMLIGHRDVVTSVATLLRSLGAERELAEHTGKESELKKTREMSISLRLAMERLPIDWSECDSISWLWGKIRRRRSSVPLVRLLHRRYGIKLIPGHAFGESATAWVAAGIPADATLTHEIAVRLNNRPRLLQLSGEELR